MSEHTTPAGKRGTEQSNSKRARTSSSRASRVGTGTPHVLEEATGDFSADYITVGVLGRGSFAEVNLLRHRVSGELFVLKTCCKLDAPSYSHLRAEATAMAAFRSADAPHPLLVCPLACSNPPGRSANYSLLMPLCPGGDLLQLLRRQPRGAFPAEHARLYAAMASLGVQALHERGFAYRDLKPDNLLLRADGYLALSDFGFACRASECGKLRVGTANYQAPEVVRKARHGKAVDWWALGVMLVEMLAGELPFAPPREEGEGGGAKECDVEAATDAAVLAHPGGVPLRCAPAVPAGAASDLVASLLEPDPAARLGAADPAAVRAASWMAELDWAALEAHSLPPPHVPPPLDADADVALCELTKRCQSGFD